MADVLQEAVDALASHLGNKAKAAKSLGVPVSTLKTRLAKAEREGKKPDEELGKIGETTERTSGDGKWITYLGSQIWTIDQFVKHHEIDLNLWKIEDATVNRWEMGAKLPDGRIAVTPLCQVKIRLKPRAKDDPELVGKAILEQVRKLANHKPVACKVKPCRDSHMLELSFPDLHLGKLAWGPEAGENYDLDIATAVYRDVLAKLMGRTFIAKIEKFLLPVGNDLIHCDSFEGTTTSGTHVDYDGRWAKMLAKARTLMIETIDMLRETAPVQVLVVPGNHDRKATLALGEVLHAYYSRDKFVDVCNQPTLRKYVNFGSNLLGFTHGDKESHNSLPHIMIREQADLYSRCVYKYWHLGHLHTRREVKHTHGDTHAGVEVKIIPSLSGTDAWHYEKGFVTSVKAAAAFLYHRDDGCVGEFYARPKADLYR